MQNRYSCRVHKNNTCACVCVIIFAFILLPTANLFAPWRIYRYCVNFHSLKFIMLHFRDTGELAANIIIPTVVMQRYTGNFAREIDYGMRVIF